MTGPQPEFVALHTRPEHPGLGTIVLSLGAAFGISVMVWERVLGIELNWIVLAFAVIILMAVGSDYNLLLVSRFKEEIHAGLKTGIIRAMGGSGSVVTSAGMVFAVTMAAMAFSALVSCPLVRPQIRRRASPRSMPKARIRS